MLHPPSGRLKVQAVRPVIRAIIAAALMFILPLGPANGKDQAPTTAPHATSHRVVILIDSDNEKVMGHAVSYAINLARSHADRNEPLAIEIVANGSGIKLFRADASPLLLPLAAMRQQISGITYSMCDASRQIAQHKEGRTIDLMPGVRLVPFGIGRVMELQEAGWSYIHG